eukprot:5787546-Amphidinium_carterae.2
MALIQPAVCQYQIVPVQVVPVIVWWQPMPGVSTVTPSQPPPARMKQLCEQAQELRAQLQQPGLPRHQALQRMWVKHKATELENRHTTGKKEVGDLCFGLSCWAPPQGTVT